MPLDQIPYFCNLTSAFCNPVHLCILTSDLSQINTALTIARVFGRYDSPMLPEPLHIEEVSGSREGVRIFRLVGPLVLANLFGFQSKVRADGSRVLILDFTAVPHVDSAGIGVLVGAYVNRQKDGRSLGLVGVNQRIRQALEVTRIESLFHFYNSVEDAERAAA